MKYENRKVRYSCSRGHTLVEWSHIHHEFEIVYVVSGSTVAVCDGVENKLIAGDLFIAFPHHVHSYRNSEDGEFQLLVFSPDEFSGFEKLFKSKRPTHPVIYKCSDSIQTVMHAINTTDFYAEYGEQKLFGYMTVLLSEIFPQLELCDRTRSDTDNIQRILQYCSVNYMNKITLDVLSQDLYINRYHISHIFNDALGMSITDYINTLRIIQAERLLRKDHFSIAEIAQAVGFSNQRTFNRVFLAKKGMTPSEFRKLEKTAAL